MKAGLKVDQHNVSCPVCSSNHTVNKYNKFNLHMLQCKNCKLVFTYPQPTSADVLQRYSKDWFEREYLPSYGIDPEHPQDAVEAPDRPAAVSLVLHHYWDDLQSGRLAAAS